MWPSNTHIYIEKYKWNNHVGHVRYNIKVFLCNHFPHTNKLYITRRWWPARPRIYHRISIKIHINLVLRGRLAFGHGVVNHDGNISICWYVDMQRLDTTISSSFLCNFGKTIRAILYMTATASNYVTISNITFYGSNLNFHIIAHCIAVLCLAPTWTVWVSPIDFRGTQKGDVRI